MLASRLAVLDFVSDILFTSSLFTMRKEFKGFAYAGLVSLLTIGVFNFTYAFWVLKTEIRNSSEFADAFQRYKKPFIFFYFLSFAKANIKSVVGWAVCEKTDMFEMFWPHNIAVKFRSTTHRLMTAYFQKHSAVAATLPSGTPKDPVIPH